MTIIEQIKAEIERRKGYISVTHFAEDLLSFLSTLEPEKPTNLEERICSYDIVPYIDDKIAALQDMWREEKVSFDWDDLKDMIEDVARHFYQKEQKPAELIKDQRQIAFMIENGQRCGVIEGRKQVIDNPEKYGLQKPAEWSEEDENKIESIKGLITMGRFADTNTIRTIWELLDSLRPSWKPSEEYIRRDKGYPDSTELIAKWKETKAMLGEKDFRGDPWRLAYNAFLDGFAKGITY